MFKDKYVHNTNKRYSSQDKVECVLELLSGAKTLKMLHEEKGVSRDVVSRWKLNFLNKVHTLFEENKDNQKDSDKDKLIARQSKEIHLLKKLLQHYKNLQKNH